MKLALNKIVAIAISLLMIISIGGASTQLLQDAHAQTLSIPTFSYINVDPNPIGVGQTVTIDFWLGVPLINSGDATGMTIYVSLPDGTKTTLGPFDSDATGGSHTTYTPTETGTYSFYMMYAGQTLGGAQGVLGSSAYVGDVEEASTSATVTLTVQSSAVSGVLFTPLPTQYWQTPVNAENVQNWYAITGPWLGLAGQPFAATGLYNASTDYNPYTLAPTTGHILWTKPWAEGGVAGGDASNTEESDYWITSQYEPKWAPVVINGVMWSTWYTGTTSESNGIVATDLYNGQTEYIINTTNPLAFGMVTYFQTVNEYGYVGPYIWTTGSLPASQTGGTAYKTQPYTTQYNMYDALTGNYICSIINGAADSVGTSAMSTDANGNLLLYYLNSTAGTEIINPNEGTTVAQTNTGPTLNCFNFTECLQTTMNFGPGTPDWLWEPALDYAYNWDSGLMWSVAVPASMSSVPAWGIGGIGSNTLVLTSGNIYGEFTGGETAGWLYAQGYSTQNGALMWSTNITETPYTRTAQEFGFGYMVDINCETSVINAYSLQTGDKIWSTTLTGDNGATPNAYDTFDLYGVVANGVIYIYGFGGDIWDLNLNTGAVIWYTNTTTLFGSPGTETPYGIWPIWIFQNVVATNPLLYLAEGHEYDPPLFHNAQEFAINETNGQLVWNVLGFDTTGNEISYGILMGLNSYDGQLYAYGQGPSSTTVTAPDVGVTTATPVTISGTVMDVSAGASQAAVKADYPNGLPCVSDASQGAWMASVYEQQPAPTNVTGVTVTLTSVDPNGNTVPIGTTTTDSSGTYAYTWTPPITGSYTIIATFAGSGAYYGSCAEAHIYAGNPPATSSPAPTPVSQATTQSYVLGIGIAVIVIIIVIGAVLAMLLLRKKP